MLRVSVDGEMGRYGGRRRVDGGRLESMRWLGLYDIVYVDHDSLDDNEVHLFCSIHAPRMRFNCS